MCDNRAVFYTQASSVIGGGHVMRCLSLAERLQAMGWSSTFICTPETLKIISSFTLGSLEICVIDQREWGSVDALSAVFSETCDVLIIDDYKIERTFESKCRSWAKRIVIIDDLADRCHDCDVLIDQSAGRDSADYRDLTSDKTTLLLGTDYALLRPEFANKRGASIARRKRAGTTKRILVSLGMTDPSHVTGAVLSAFDQCAIDMEVEVVLGSSAPHLDKVRAQIETMKTPVHLHVDHPRIADLMVQADLAIGAAGSTSWERCCLGLPCLMVVIADNQREISKALEARGVAIVLGDTRHFSSQIIPEILKKVFDDPDRLSQMSTRALDVCDGLGVARVLNALVPVYAQRGVCVCSRPVRNSDVQLIYGWQRMEGARIYCRNPTPPTWDEHVEWFERRLHQVTGVFELLEVHGEPVGVVRLDPFDHQENEYEVSILVALDRQGQGVGTAGLEILHRLMPEGIMWAHILSANEASRKMFRRAGFFSVEEELFCRTPGESQNFEV